MLSPENRDRLVSMLGRDPAGDEQMDNLYVEVLWKLHKPKPKLRKAKDPDVPRETEPGLDAVPLMPVH